MADASGRSSRFADLLKEFRARRGLSQLQLASVTGYSQRHISFLELGRSNPTRAAVLVLADALCESLEARNALLRAARFADEYPASPLDGDQLKLAMDACRRTLKALRPFPAVLIDRQWNVLGANRTANAFFGQLQTTRSPWTGDAANGMRTHFEPKGLRPYILNWPEVAQHFMVRVRLRLLAEPGNEVARGIVRDFGGEVDDLLTRQTRSAPSGEEAAFTIALGKGRQRFRYQTLFSAFSDPQDITAAQLTIESFIPADEATREHFFDLEARAARQ
jgi:transcriptional regulator with XRE-family HTH domain